MRKIIEARDNESRYSGAQGFCARRRLFNIHDLEQTKCGADVGQKQVLDDEGAVPLTRSRVQPIVWRELRRRFLKFA